jgi:hypothetical protein
MGCYMFTYFKYIYKADMFFVLNLGVCILLRVLDQGEGFPSNETLCL